MSTLVTSTAQVGTIKDAAGNNTAMTIDGSGRVVTPQRPAFFCRGYGSLLASGAHTLNGITISTNHRITTWDEVTLNVGSHFSNSTGIFTVPVAGLYQVTMNIGYKAADNYSMANLYLTSNDHVDYGYISAWTSGNHSGNDSYNGTSATAIVSASVGQQFAMTYHGSYTTGHGSIIQYSSFGGYLIG